MPRITRVKYMTTKEPECPDKQIIITLLESIGYRVIRTYPQWGGMLYVVFSDSTTPKRKNKSKVVRKITSRIPLKAYDIWKRWNHVGNDRVLETVVAVEMDRNRSFEGINDLLSTFKVNNE